MQQTVKELEAQITESMRKEDIFSFDVLLYSPDIFGRYPAGEERCEQACREFKKQHEHTRDLQMKLIKLQMKDGMWLNQPARSVVKTRRSVMKHLD